MQRDEHQIPQWKAGEWVPAGTYVRIDDSSYKVITLQQAGPLPATFDGHIALYREFLPLSPGLNSSVRTHLS